MSNMSFDSLAENRKTILFVEDEPLIRMDMADFLRECGYRVHEAASAVEALETLRADFGVDLVFTDINLPNGMSGLELADWVARNRPTVCVLVTTGAGSWWKARLPEDRILPKPYGCSDLLGWIRWALSARTGAF